ncbi:N-acetylmuramic acid 6-phosphate etherase [Arachidicoccus ginsenosidimutans]|uniref:N-acetylmuramic acid 6-phosphate etherase n=1 Tax=Arachidicoccus sp. BS20 TaxID=1850526 RepID=UPI0007F0A9F6|nr:N-acetylmuramic acid 6-phosphate etherase [Arachidicoccus sp. BS20]ANI88173.1 N-acetylmuramic acid 6-phosphate etherase [Arachidicoccus sp. BS20]
MQDYVRVTEQPSPYRHLEKMPVKDLLEGMNKEDECVPKAVQKAIPQIEKLINAVVEKLQLGGRLFYIGAGTSGRLGVLDASECPPTFGVPEDLINGIIAGGETALRHAVENAEDDYEQGWQDLLNEKISTKDFVIGLTASGGAPYVLGALENCKQNNIATGCITCNANAYVAQVSDYPVEVIVGAEFLTGSTRLKSGTAQKLVLNMISTITMIRLNKVHDNQMVNMQLTNEKLIDRGTRMLMNNLNIDDYQKAKELLLKYGSVAKAEENFVFS